MVLSTIGSTVIPGLPVGTSGLWFILAFSPAVS